jgi:hypothetical protein
VLDVCAALAALCGEWNQAARFLGAVESQTEHTAYHRDPADEAFLAPLITEARQRLSASTFEYASAEGRTLCYDEAIAQARAWLGDLSV